MRYLSKSVLLILSICLLVIPNTVSAIDTVDNRIIIARTENSITYSLGNNKYAIDSYIYPIHYKDNYSDKKEQWKAIDLTIVNNKITKAPYILTIHDNDIYDIVDKRTNDSLSIKPYKIGDTMAKLDDFTIRPFNTGFKLTRIINTKNDAHNSEFLVSQEGISIDIYTRAYDADGKEIKIDYEIIGNRLFESIDLKELVDIKYPITIDPIIDIQAGASTDDAGRRYDGAWSTTEAYLDLGNTTASADFGVRYLAVTIPHETGLTIDTAYITLTAYNSKSSTTVNVDIYGEDSATPATYSTEINFDNRVNTTAKVDWNNVPAFVTDTEYDTPELKTIVQELIDTFDYSLGRDMALMMFDDGSSGSTIRHARSYDNDSAKAPKLHIEYTVDFITLSPPYNFVIDNLGAITTTIDWTKGENSEYSMIRASVVDYPKSIADGELIYYNGGISFNSTNFLVDKTYFASAWGYDSNNVTYSANYTIFNIGGEDMVISHLLALIPLLVLLILSLVFWGKGLVHITTCSYALTLGYIAIVGGWELLFFPIIVGVVIMTIILFAIAMSKGNWL